MNCYCHHSGSIIIIFIIDIIHSFIYSGYFYSSFTSPLLLRGAPDTARILCRSFTPKRHMQLRVKNFPKIPTWRLEWGSNPRPFWRKATNLPMNQSINNRLMARKPSCQKPQWAIMPHNIILIISFWSQPLTLAVRFFNDYAYFFSFAKSD